VELPRASMVPRFQGSPKDDSALCCEVRVLVLTVVAETIGDGEPPAGTSGASPLSRFHRNPALVPSPRENTDTHISVRRLHRPSGSSGARFRPSVAEATLP